MIPAAGTKQLFQNWWNSWTKPISSWHTECACHDEYHRCIYRARISNQLSIPGTCSRVVLINIITPAQFEVSQRLPRTNNLSVYCLEARDNLIPATSAARVNTDCPGRLMKELSINTGPALCFPNNGWCLFTKDSFKTEFKPSTLSWGAGLRLHKPAVSRSSSSNNPEKT